MPARKSAYLSTLRFCSLLLLYPAKICVKLISDQLTNLIFRELALSILPVQPKQAFGLKWWGRWKRHLGLEYGGEGLGRLQQNAMHHIHTKGEDVC